MQLMILLSTNWNSIELKHLIGFEAHCKFDSRTIRIQIEILLWTMNTKKKECVCLSKRGKEKNESKLLATANERVCYTYKNTKPWTDNDKIPNLFVLKCTKVMEENHFCGFKGLLMGTNTAYSDR